MGVQVEQAGGCTKTWNYHDFFYGRQETSQWVIRAALSYAWPPRSHPENNLSTRKPPYMCHQSLLCADTACTWQALLGSLLSFAWSLLSAGYLIWSLRLSLIVERRWQGRGSVEGLCYNAICNSRRVSNHTRQPSLLGTWLCHGMASTGHSSAQDCYEPCENLRS